MNINTGVQVKLSGFIRNFRDCNVDIIDPKDLPHTPLRLLGIA
jgi:hypothetical protein